MANRIKCGVRAGVASLITAAALSLVVVPTVLADADSAMRWWNKLSPEQMVAAGLFHASGKGVIHEG